MNKIILQARNEKELEQLIKRNITLEKDETYSIRTIKSPFKFLFIDLKGKYEISILKKSELKELENEKATKTKIEKKEKVVKKVVENVNEKPMNQLNELDEKIKGKFTDFLKTANLNIEIEKIETKNHFKILHIKGKDVRYLIGEKGIVLNSLENLFNLIKEFKGYKILVDSNDYKSKREETIRNFANKKAKKVLETKNNCKLSPMTARERRIIHEEVGKYPNLKTESYGEEPKRYLVIKYIDKKEE